MKQLLDHPLITHLRRSMPKGAKANAPPHIVGLEHADITLSKATYRIGPQIGAGGFGLIFLGRCDVCCW